jgi:hypothetical protein
MLHQLSRDTDDRGRVVATIGDYEVVHGLTAAIVAEAAGATVPASVRETVEVVAGRQQRAAPGEFGGVKITDIAGELKIERSAAQRRVQTARDRGYLDNLEDKRGRPGRYALGDPMPGETAVLPPPEQVCTGPSCAHQAAHPPAHHVAHPKPQVSE